MRSAFIDKLIKRMDRLEPGEVQGVVLELLREKGLLEKVFEALQEGVILLDTEGKVTYVNRAACQFFGINGEQAIGQRLGQGLRDLDWNELLKPGTVVTRDIEVLYPENRFLNFYITSIADDQQLGFVMLIRDVTESRRRTEQQIESERLNAFTLLAAGVAHELGNPLNSLTIHLQLLERRIRKLGKQGENLREHLDVATGEIKRLDFIISQFLSAIRPTQPQMQRARINEIIEESLAFLKPEIEKAKVAVTCELRADMPAMPLDAAQMKQAFYNLIRNACQAMPEGGSLKVAGTFNDFEVRVSFEDTGKGISPEQMGKLFQPFSTTRPTGTGLGLLIVRRIVREHGGEIDVESREGKGTRISLWLPLVEKKVRLLEGAVVDSQPAEPQRPAV
ncbi:MAG: PAS domain-containing protein [Verrucomicrobiaceae bacterium]|nr:PAS domain-containing protein [Verrucomicrobiaceae bacterium]